MRVFDTAAKGFTEVDHTKDLRIYVCGITPYDSAHIGHAFTFLTYDLVRRHAEAAGANVHLVRNITDVDEPMYVKARELGMNYLDLAKQQAAEFSTMMRALNLLDPAVEPKPSDHILEIAEAVKKLLNRGVAYELEGDIYFDITQSTSFGAISGYSDKLKNTFSSSRGGDPERKGKRNPLDFLLWRAIVDETDVAAWSTEVGYGRPGWHIECSVMSNQYLGADIDIHGGGTDLIFPHHECENAQSTALGHDPFVKTWMHAAPMLLGGDKMSKSLGNLVFVRDILQQTEPAALRIALMSYHYRSGGEWRNDLLAQAVDLLAGIRQALRQPSGGDPRPFRERIIAALNDDLNAPEAIRVLQEMVQATILGNSSPNAAEGLRGVLDLLGIDAAADV
ncbi:class I tRNA ligase family protein [Nocardia vinacea]|uniref:class I tRNA ligase family protein n=1 Tax=Nocardia vinacea TaxID=96468 RepID=UPI000684B529|nr:class I tRNA ligase family protein [Nocardia vinacea]